MRGSIPARSSRLRGDRRRRASRTLATSGPARPFGSRLRSTRVGHGTLVPPGPGRLRLPTPGANIGAVRPFRARFPGGGSGGDAVSSPHVRRACDEPKKRQWAYGRVLIPVSWRRTPVARRRFDPRDLASRVNEIGGVIEQPTPDHPHRRFFIRRIPIPRPRTTRRRHPNHQPTNPAPKGALDISVAPTVARLCRAGVGVTSVEESTPDVPRRNAIDAHHPGI